MGKKSGSSYSVARRNDWLEKCCKHMVECRKPDGYWVFKSNVLVEAEKYSTNSEWQKKSSSSYQSARLNGW